MKQFAVAIFGLAILSACGPTVQGGATGNRLLTEDQFRDTVVGRTATLDTSTIIVHPDGRVTGSAPNGVVTGRWNWQDGYFCRVVSIGGTASEPDCQTVAVDGANVTYIRDQGRGDALTWTLG